MDKSLTDDQRRVRHDVRMSRRWQVVERRDAPDYLLMIDESVLLRDVGGPRVMAEQLELLAEVARRPNVHIRVLPLDKGAFIGSFGPFMVLNMDADDDEDAVLYRESDISDDLNQDVEEVGRHRRIFEAYWYESLDEEASAGRTRPPRPFCEPQSPGCGPRRLWRAEPPEANGSRVRCR